MILATKLPLINLSDSVKFTHISTYPRVQFSNGSSILQVLGKSGGGASATFDDNENLLEDEKFPGNCTCHVLFSFQVVLPCLPLYEKW